VQTRQLHINDVIPGGIKASDRWHRTTNDNTCSRCFAGILDHEVPAMLWRGDDLLIYCCACLGEQHQEEPE
jgi:hypothetical protein